MDDTGPDMRYDTGGIRSGGARAASAGEAADAAAGRLGRARIAAGLFGEVAGADGLATGLGSTRDAFAETGRAVAARHADLQARANATAEQGDELVPETSAVAQRGGPGSISAGMAGP